MEQKKSKTIRYDCAFFDVLFGCRALKPRVCDEKRCTFYITTEKLVKNSEIDFLYESFLKGKIDRERYFYLMDCYHKGKMKKIAR
jgi:hypothetical protein